jgi:retron-type reverse transcriptase
VISTRSRTGPVAQAAATPERRSAFHIADVLLPVSLILWAVGLSRTDPNNLGGYGLVTALSPIFYAGVVLLVISALAELRRARPSRWRMTAHAASLVVMLYATPAIVYPEGRYSWLYKTIGVVQYINHYGHLDRHIDIYQNWPGFFALAAWFGKVAGVGTPLLYAKWAQVIFELAALPLLYLAYAALSLSVWQRWMALLLYAASNWIGQDYYSPQALGTIISLGIMAMLLRWLYGGNRDPLTRRRRFFRKRAAVPQAARQPDRSPTVSRVEVYEAYRTMRGYQGPPGIDGITIRDFEQHLPRNLQRVWTQLRDGTYRPSPIRLVPPPGGRGRPLSVLTVSDMIAQIVIARKLEAEFSRRREKDRERLSRRARVAPGRWNVEVDAHAVFTTCRHDLLLRVVESATDEEWLAGYVSRFLQVAERQPDTSSGSRRLGTMPGSPLSTVLADLFLYYALDRWAMDHFPEVKVFRELDTAVVHCQSEHQARSMRAAIWQRLDDVSLRVSKGDIRVERATRGEQTEVFAMPPAEPVTPSGPEQIQQDRAASRAAKARARANSGRSWAILITLFLLFFILSFTHELSPYILIVQIAVLAGGRLLRPRWLPIAFAAIAFGYLLPRLAYVNSTYGLLSSIGSFFSNVAPPSATTDTLVTIPSAQIFDQRTADILSLLMWLLAVIGAWRRRRSGRTVLALFALTFSPALVLAAQAYGNEGVLRVYLFSLPWAAALAAAALEPRSATLSRISAQLRGLRPGTGPERGAKRRAVLNWVRPALGLGLVLALFFPAFFGDDASNVMTKSETDIIYQFLQTAKLGPIYSAGDNAPQQDTWRYPDFQMPTIFGTGDGDPLVTKATPDLADIIAKDSLTYTKNKQPAYVMISPSMLQYSIAFGETPASSYTILINSLNKSPKWKLLVNKDGTSIYELPPGQG